MGRFDTPDPLLPEQYRQDVDSLPPPPGDEERVRLYRDLRHGSPEERAAAREHLALTSMRLVVSVARKFRWAGLPYADTVQNGSIGLLRGARQFDPAKGAFSTYVWEWIRQGIRRGLLNGRHVYLPDRQYNERGRPIIAAMSTLTEHGDPITPDAISQITRIPISEVEITLDALRDPWSLDAPVFDSDDGDTPSHVDALLSDEPDPGAFAEASDLWQNVLVTAQQIPDPLARAVVIRYYNLDGRQTGQDRKARVNFVTLGRELGCSREWIRQHHDIGIAWMREHLTDGEAFTRHEELFSGIVQSASPRIL